jgi:quercetin dioxygenase-like cupin family protein
MGTTWEWPDELDALTAAPANHRLLLENDRVRVIETVVPAGTRTPVHTHRWASAAYVLSASSFVRRDGAGTVLLDTRRDGGEPRPAAASWAEPFPPHSLENVGEAELRVIMVELKEPSHRTPAH